MKTFSDAVRFSETPHSYDFLTPGFQSIPQSCERIERRIFEALEVMEKKREKSPALFFGSVFGEEKATEFLFKFPNSI